MKITLDENSNVGYIYINEIVKNNVFESREINEEIVIDLNKDGNIIGIELLNAKKQMDLFDIRKISFENENKKILKEMFI